MLRIFFFFSIRLQVKENLQAVISQPPVMKILFKDIANLEDGAVIGKFDLFA